MNGFDQKFHVGIFTYVRGLQQAQSNEEKSEKRADSKYVHTSLDNVEPNKKVDELDSNPSDVSGRHQK